MDFKHFLYFFDKSGRGIRFKIYYTMSFPNLVLNHAHTLLPLKIYENKQKKKDYIRDEFKISLETKRQMLKKY